MSTSFIKGVSPTGEIIPLRLNEDGSMGSATGGGDATAANQQTEIQRLTEIRDRLDDLKSYTDGLEASLSVLQGYTDGLETLLAAANATSSAISGYVDGLEGLTAAVRDRLPPLTAAAPKISDISLSTDDAPFYTATHSLTNVTRIAFQVRSGGDVEFCYDPQDAFYPLVAGMEEEQVFNGKFTGTLYLRSPATGVTVVIKESY